MTMLTSHIRCIALGFLAWTLAGAAFAEQVRIVRLSPATQTALPGQLAPTPFRLRVERLNGEPIPGVRLYYGILIACDPGADCPDDTELGGFEPPGGPGVNLTTGSDGTATTPPYRAGRPLSLPYALQFGPILPPQQTTPGGIIVDDWPLSGDYHTTVIVQGLVSVPTLGTVGMATLVGLLAAAGLWTVARTRS